MLNDFFKLNKEFEIFDRNRFSSHLKTSRHICNILYEPDIYDKEKVKGVKFENISFSKTTIADVTFSECTFQDCLFIATKFKYVAFHDCKFENCNFYKSKFHSLYARPHQFRKSITDEKYANIAVHLYHQLRENYYQESQREFKNEAEYYFGHWNRKNEYIQAKRKKKKWYSYIVQHIGSYLYGYLLGYGYRLRNLIATTFVLLSVTTWANYTFANYFFTEPVEKSLIKTIYFTLTTMATLGASGYSPDTEVGYLFVVANVIFGISILSATIGAIFKKVIR
jgi:hypothetical protein